MKNKYRRGRHSVSLLHAHLVFCIKFRRRVITPRAFEILRRAMRRSAAALEIDLIAIEADGDHLHVMLCYPPTISLSKIVQRLKGTSSRALRQRKLSEVIRKLWGKAFWPPSYFVVSCGCAPLETVKACVENQTNPNRSGRRQHEPISPRNFKPPSIPGLKSGDRGREFEDYNRRHWESEF